MKKEFLKILFFNLFFLIIILLVLELTVRIFKLSGMQGYQAEILHDKIHRLKPNTEGETGGVKFYTDNKGFRIPYKNYNYKKADKILFLGDSVTFGVGVKEEDSFVGKYRKNSLAQLMLVASFHVKLMQGIQKYELISNPTSPF